MKDGKDIFDIFHGRVFHGRAVNYRKDGSEFMMQWKIAPIFNEKNEDDPLPGDPASHH